MDIKKSLILLLFGAFVWTGCNPDTPIPEPVDPSEIDQFPELVSACSDWKMGGGAASVGGSQGTTIYRVTTLEDSDPFNPQIGSLRYAVNQSGPRVIVFSVGGTIHLKAPLEITRGNLTILGQSAPGQGICLADYPIIVKKTNNVIIRFIRCRLGNISLEKDPKTDYDAMSINDCRNVMIDHCSFSWSVDECVSCYGNENFTLQYCFVTESLRDAGHEKGAHGYGGIWGGKNASFHHNLLAHHDSRNPRFDHDYVDIKYAGPIDFVNNVIYNWGKNSAYGGEGSSKGAGGRHINMVNNYFKHGPSTSSDVKVRLVDPWTSCSNCTKATDGAVQPGGTLIPPVLYLSGNYMFAADTITEDNWKGATHNDEEVKTQTRWTGVTILPNEQTATVAYQTVLDKAGCSLSRDAVDERLVSEVKTGKGKLIDKPADVGGWPDLDTDSSVEDTDKDGMPDEWENKYGLNPNSPYDASKVTLVTKTMNIEVYLNDLVRNLY